MAKKRGRPPKKAQIEPENGKNEQNEAENEQKPENQAEKQVKKEEIDGFMTPFEAAEYFGTSEATIKLWVQHRILRQEINGLIPLRSIQRCKFKTRRVR